LDIVPALIKLNLTDYLLKSSDEQICASIAIREELCNFVIEPCQSSPIEFECPTSGTFNRFIMSIKHLPLAKKVLCGYDFQPFYSPQLAKCSSEYHQTFVSDTLFGPLSSTKTGSVLETGLMKCGLTLKWNSLVDLPSHGRLVTDCAKMRIFAELIERMHREKHRCLVFCQMTKMIDILEDFMTWKKFTYFRMDGSTTTQDRGAMVDQFQTNDNIFAFLLSTRAGGLGLNLVAADTVIFYDNDWNPTMDEQAQDRVHRIGQTKPVTVYRILTNNSVEEKIVKRAK
jgi:SNF2 family DNA or RNA helicase